MIETPTETFCRFCLRLDPERGQVEPFNFDGLVVRTCHDCLAGLFTGPRDARLAMVRLARRYAWDRGDVA